MEYTHAKCLNDVSDDLGVYNYAGKIYEIVEIYEGGIVDIECEPVDGVDEIRVDEIRTTLKDRDFEFLIIEDK